MVQKEGLISVSLSNSIALYNSLPKRLVTFLRCTSSDHNWKKKQLTTIERKNSGTSVPLLWAPKSDRSPHHNNTRFLNGGRNVWQSSFWFLLNQIWIVITLTWLIWHQTEFHLVPNQSEKYNYNPNLVRINNIQNKISLH